MQIDIFNQSYRTLYGTDLIHVKTLRKNLLQFAYKGLHDQLKNINPDTNLKLNSQLATSSGIQKTLLNIVGALADVPEDISSNGSR